VALTPLAAWKYRNVYSLSGAIKLGCMDLRGTHSPIWLVFMQPKRFGRFLQKYSGGSQNVRDNRGHNDQKVENTKLRKVISDNDRIC
jgi:hypothetical protein